MKIRASVCVLVVLAGGRLGSAGQKPDLAALLEGYNRCNREFETIAYDLESESVSEKGRLVYTVRHCADHDKVQWIGRRAFYPAQADPQSVVSERVADTYDGTRLAHLYRDFSPKFPTVPPAGLVYGPSGSLMAKIRQEWSESTEYGGPLVGRIAGSENHSVYELLKEASDVTLHKSAAQILGYDAYLLEAKTKYGIVRAWIAPDAGCNCLKWEIVKTQNQLYRDGATTDDPFTHWATVYDIERVEQIDGRYITTQGKLSWIVKDGDRELGNHTQRYRLTNIDFDPDYEAMGAFKIQLPEGTIVGDGDTEGVTYRWTGGQLVPLIAKTRTSDKPEVVLPSRPGRSTVEDDPNLALVSKDNLHEHVRILAGFESRHILHPGNKKAEEYIARQLEKCGYAPKLDAFEAANRTFNNVLSAGSDKERPIILLTAHFDSTDGPGADDNASGVAALLELARIVKERPVQTNVEFVFFNCEERGTVGSRHLSNEYKDRHWPIDCVINVDTIGTWNGPLSDACPVNYVTDANSEPVVKQLAERFPYPLRKAKTMWRDDHARFWDNGFKAIEITEDGCTEHMHKPTDTPEKLDYDNIARIVHGLYVALSRE